MPSYSDYAERTLIYYSFSLRSIQLIMKECNVKTVRRNGLSPVDQGVAILQEAEDDPLGRWGVRLVKEKLALKGNHISR